MKTPTEIKHLKNVRHISTLEKCLFFSFIILLCAKFYTDDKKIITNKISLAEYCETSQVHSQPRSLTEYCNKHNSNNQQNQVGT